ncbi:MAG: LrgB family protein [Micavibrio sp.]|nr:LrgB family protein [Micavibrio sp.]
MMDASLILSALFWSTATIALYAGSKAAHKRLRKWWSAPVIIAPVLLIALALAAHVSYGDYIHGTHWLLMLIGPATVAFAAPIYAQRALIRRHWPVLLAGMVTGSAVSMLSAYALAQALGLDRALMLSLIPRSVSTPFAMSISAHIGGVPALSAVFVIITGVIGAIIGEALLYRLPLRSPLSRGALFGAGAHAVGTNKAYQLNVEDGAIAGLVMVLSGIGNVLLAPVLLYLLS